MEPEPLELCGNGLEGTHGSRAEAGVNREKDKPRTEALGTKSRDPFGV